MFLSTIFIFIKYSYIFGPLICANRPTVHLSFILHAFASVLSFCMLKLKKKKKNINNNYYSSSNNIKNDNSIMRNINTWKKNKCHSPNQQKWSGLNCESCDLCI